MDDSVRYRIGESWSRALKVLCSDERDQILPFQSNVSNVMDEILKEVQAKRDEAMAKRWKLKRSDGTIIILRDVFEKILLRVSRYTQVMNIVANADPIHAGLPWALVRFLLQASVSDLQAVGSLNEGIELIADVLVRYRILENVCASPRPAAYVNEQSHLSDCIVRVYTAILVYIANAKKYFSQNTATRMAKGIFKNLEAEHQTLQLAVSKADQEAFRMASIVQYQDQFNVSKATQDALTDLIDEMRAPFFRIAQDVFQIRDQLQQSHLIEIFHWLSTVPCELHHHEACKKTLPHTGKWLLECSTFLDWQRSSSSEIFWLNGIPGSGKSKLASIVIQTLQAEACTQRPLLAYFYCSQKSTDPRTADTREILCALLRQLAGRDARLALRGIVAQDFERRKEKADQSGAQLLSLDIPEITAHILAIANDDPLTIVLDALDEVDETKREELFDALEQIMQQSQNVVKLFVSSRNDGDIVERFAQHPNVRVDGQKNQNDIQNFIKHKVDEAIKTKKLLRGKVSLSLQDEIVKTLREKAHGMFRWVELSVDMLSNPRRLSVEKDVRCKLGQLPETLKQQYEIILQDILESASSTASIARRVFVWILAAQRALTVEEFVAAVALDNDGYYHADLDAPTLLDICRNLIVVVSTDDKSSSQSFQVAHLSVKEYLEGIPEFSAKRIHTHVTMRCLQVFDPQLLVGNQFSYETKRGTDPIREYSVYLFEHAQMSELIEPFSAKAPLMKSFLFDNRFESTPKFHDWINIVEHFFEDFLLDQDTKDTLLYWKMQYGFTKNGIWLICRYGLLSVLEILGDNADIPWKHYSSLDQSSPFEAATQNNKHAVAKWLLERGIFDADEHHGFMTPLCFAVQSEDVTMVNLLLEHGAYPHLVRTAWVELFRKKHLEIFKRLLESINLRTFGIFKFCWKSEALFAALWESWTEVVEILIRHGADIHSRTSRTDWPFPSKYRYSTTLQVAIERSDITAINMLLKAASKPAIEATERKGEKIAPNSVSSYANSLDGHGRSALHYLMGRQSSIPNEGALIMSVLLKQGADPRIVCRDGITALHVAAAIGSQAILQSLIEEGLDPKIRSYQGVTILHAAAGGNCSTPSVVRFLIDEGMDPLDHDYHGRNALYHAAAACNIIALEALIKAILGIESITELQALNSAALVTSNNKNDAVVNLESKRRDVLNNNNHEGETLLHIVGTERNNTLFDHKRNIENFNGVIQIKETVRLLLDLGVDKNRRNNKGRTALSKLVNLPLDPDSAIIAAKMLLDNGADPDLSDSSGWTPLHYAVDSSRKEAMKNLIKAGADIESRDQNLRTPLHIYFLDTRSSFVIWFLLRQKANHGARDQYGATPLHYAARSSCRGGRIELLIKARADLNAVDNLGLTPLHWAARSGRLCAVKALLNAGAIPDVLDNSGLSAIEIAAIQASTILEHKQSLWNTYFLKTWYLLYRASEKRYHDKSLRPRGFILKRSQSVILRTDQTWGSFDDVWAERYNAHWSGSGLIFGNRLLSDFQCDFELRPSVKHFAKN